MNPSIPQPLITDVPVITRDKGVNLSLELLRRAIFNEDEKPLLVQWSALKTAEKKRGAS